MKNKFIPVALSAAILALVLACTNPASGDPGIGSIPPPERLALLNLLATQLPNVKSTVAEGSEYEGLIRNFNRILVTEGEAPFVDEHLARLYISLEAQEGIWDDNGKGKDILTLPGSNGRLAGNGLADYIDEVIVPRVRAQQENMHAGMVPVNSR